MGRVVGDALKTLRATLELRGIKRNDTFLDCLQGAVSLRRCPWVTPVRRVPTRQSGRRPRGETGRMQF